jgi:hypothetical protein
MHEFRAGPATSASPTPKISTWECHQLKMNGILSSAVYSGGPAPSFSQSQLSVCGALRTKDNTVTIMVINKTYGTLKPTLTVNNLTATTTSAQAYLHSNANVAATVPQPTAKVTPPAQGSAANTITTSFPAQSITLLVMPN